MQINRFCADYFVTCWYKSKNQLCFYEGSTWQSCDWQNRGPRIPDRIGTNWNLEMLISVEGGKPENPEKNPPSKDENQQQTQPNCLNWKINCDDHSSFSSTTAVHIWIISYKLHIKLNPLVTPGLGFEPGPHWWEASAITTAPSLLPDYTRVFLSKWL